ncbi:hypothetical protein EDF51_103101 [Curtobacterium sp. PhB25]|uniref:hypothetical protein n=1 Tax=unclassified Curtobacterium TaxID=257496 RepID=UPI0010440ABB|nr:MULTISPECIES: hypothetical protein [unclassified Curtobacterium]TCU49826.1 hypothetical protein EDF33_101320 [Curtobacterium sp. PhB146]TDW49443.1 hypothetical protein EDF52_104217 [Curtobacterium sp. PhB42]TDW56520.1 hypothetical protein EDF47_103106 [Curtobacterium sp. PhB190]TDW72641.1 hypothetical protein EDF51_103101 [Curtobacterium sp. PhB25]
MSQTTKSMLPTVARRRGNADSAAARVAVDSAERVRRQSRGNANEIVIGRRPSADLLPTEVLADRRARRVVRRMWAGVVLVAVLVGIAIGGADLLSTQSHDDLVDAQNQTLSLLRQQAQFKEVRETETGTVLREAARSVGGSTEIAWQPYLTSLKSSLPAGVAITGVAIDSATPLEAYAQADTPLQGQRVATLTIDAQSPTLPSVPEWLDAVKGLTGFVDATANSVTLDETTGTYTVNMTIHVDDAAYDGKYQDKGE